MPTGKYNHYKTRRSEESYEEEIRELREKRSLLKTRMEELTRMARNEIKVLTKKINGLETQLSYKRAKKEYECVGKD